MRKTIISLCVVWALAGCGASQVTGAYPQASSSEPAPAAQASSDQGDNRWESYESRSWGIRLAVPNPEACVQRTQSQVGHLFCDYGDVVVEVFAIQGQLPVADLRDIAVEVTEIPPSLWRWEGESRYRNGYLGTEAWSASGNGYTMIGLIGQSAVRDVSHVVFIYGSDRAMSRHASVLGHFVANIEAI